MQTSSALFPVFWGVAIFTGLLANHYTALANAKFLSMRGLGLALFTLIGAIIFGKASSVFPHFPISLGFATYILAGYSGGVLSFYTRKLYKRN